MLTLSDYVALAGPTVTVGVYVAAALRRSRIQRDQQHADNQQAIAALSDEAQQATAALKDKIGDLRDQFGNRLTAVEVALEHMIGWSGTNGRRSHDER